MCGIAGIFHLETPKPVDPARLRSMTDAIAHRGPDSADIWTAPGVGLGFRRLAIIDLATGDQPMTSQDGRHVLIFNGEIYNYRELREELAARGHPFRTHSDTEVILAAFRQWGPMCLERLNGMFAFAIYDNAEQSLFLARDRLGVKPLHYAVLGDGALLFASELKALMAHPLLRRTPDLSAVEDFLALGYVPDDACLIAGVQKLPAGHCLTLVRGNTLPKPVQWWDVRFTADAQGSVAKLEEELIERMRAAVTSRMIADVPLGAFLSGGVDSSGVVALMAEASREAVQTCSIGFDRADHDETRYADRIAERFATKHAKRIVSADDFDLVDTLVAAFDEPFADASALPTYRVCQLAREKVTVALSGDGADEAFAGYRRHRFFAAEERARGLVPHKVRQPVFGTLGRLYPKADWAPRALRAKTSLEALALPPEEAYALAVGVTPPAIRARLFTDEAKRMLGGYRAEERYHRTMRDAPAADALGRAQYADMKIWLTGDILTKVDRTSMAVSLEAREPLLDYKLVEFAASLPLDLRIRGGVGKWLMKRALRPYLPEDILYRTKQGFVTPVSEWFRGPLAGAAAAIASGSALARSGWFNVTALGEIVAEHKSGRSDHGRLLWQLLMLDKSLTRLFPI